MSKRKSKLKLMAAAGDPWAIRMLAQARAQGRSAGLRGQAMQRARTGAGGAFAEAMRDAEDIRHWTDGPNASSWRIYRLAQALVGGRG